MVFHVLAAGAEISLDENLHNRLHHALGQATLFIDIGDLKQVAALLGDFDLRRHRVDQPLLFLIAFHGEIQIGHQNDLLEIGPAEKRAAHDIDLLEQVHLDRDSLHEGAEHGVHIDINSRRGFIAVR